MKIFYAFNYINITPVSTIRFRSINFILKGLDSTLKFLVVYFITRLSQLSFSGLEWCGSIGRSPLYTVLQQLLPHRRRKMIYYYFESMAGILKKNETKRFTDFYRSPGGYQSIKWCAILQAPWWIDCNVSGRSVSTGQRKPRRKHLSIRIR